MITELIWQEPTGKSKEYRAQDTPYKFTANGKNKIVFLTTNSGKYQNFLDDFGNHIDYDDEGLKKIKHRFNLLYNVNICLGLERYVFGIGLFKTPQEQYRVWNLAQKFFFDNFNEFGDKKDRAVHMLRTVYDKIISETFDVVYEENDRVHVVGYPKDHYFTGKVGKVVGKLDSNWIVQFPKESSKIWSTHVIEPKNLVREY